MTLVNIDLKNAGYETGPDDRVVFYSPANRNEQGTIISTAETSVALVDGQASKELAPGPVVVQILAQGVADTRQKSGYVPDEGPVSLWDVVLDWTPALVDQGILSILAVLDAALGQVEGAVAAELGAKLDSKAEISYVDTSVPPVMPAVNLWDDSAWENATMAPNGVVTPHDKHRLSPHIPVIPSMTYSSTSVGLHRMIWFSASGAAITDTDTAWQPRGTHIVWTSPVGAVTARLVMVPDDLEGAATIFNRGAVLFDPDRPSTGYWEGRELPPVDADGVAAVARAEVDSLRDESGKIAATNIDGAVPKAETPVNLFDPTTATFETMAPNGFVTPSSTHRLSPFLPVDGGKTYLGWAERSYRVVWFDSSQVAITGTDTAWQATGADPKLWVAPANAAWARVLNNAIDPQSPVAWFGRSDTVFDPLNPPDTLPSSFWDDRELPPGGGGISEEDLEQLRADLLSEVDGIATVPHFQPSTPTLNFDPDWYVGYARPRWLSQDGEMLWGSRGFILEQSSDEWATRQTVHEFPQGVEGVRETEDGELLVTTLRDEANDIRSKLYKSSGYDRANPTAATWTEVLQTVSKQADFKSHWGLFVAGNMITASEYGLRNIEGSRRVWLSEDYGATWTMIFDQMTVQAPGGPVWDPNAHLHGAAWDEYWQRVWVICGDTPSTATYWSDDKGATWNFVPGSNEMQYTGIMPLPDVVVFGSDRTPNGLHYYIRGQKTDTPVIKPLLVVDHELTTAKAFGLPFKRDRHPATETYFPGPDAGFKYPSVLTGFVDGRKGHLLWQGETPGSGLPLSGTLAEVFGPTAQGNVLAVMFGDPTVSGIRTMKAPAPTWERV